MLESGLTSYLKFKYSWQCLKMPKDSVIKLHRSNAIATNQNATENTWECTLLTTISIKTQKICIFISQQSYNVPSKDME
jgi:hypothetical protein